MRDVTLVRQAADRLKTLIDRLLDISRIRSGQLQLEREPTDVAAITESIVLMLAETSGRKITMQASPPLKSYRAAVDGVRIEEVVVNLIDNAVKYSPRDTAIDVELTSTPDAIHIAVRDRGPGIELAERMMDSYPLIGVVLLSGYIAETLHLERATARGATFVAKPVSSTQLLETVGRAVALRQAASNRPVNATPR